MTTQASQEQDLAAGGRERRMFVWDGKQATASVQLGKRDSKGSTPATLRFKSGGRTRNIHVGRVEGEDRMQMLQDAWRLVHDRGLLKSL